MTEEWIAQVAADTSGTDDAARQKSGNRHKNKH